MVWFHIEELLIGQQLRHRSLALLGHTAVQQLVQNWDHFLPQHGPAFKKDFTDGQYLAVAQASGNGVDQLIYMLPLVVNQLLRQPLLRQEEPHDLHIPLDAALRNMEPRGQFFFAQRFPMEQFVIDCQHSGGFEVCVFLQTCHLLPEMARYIF